MMITNAIWLNIGWEDGSTHWQKESDLPGVKKIGLVHGEPASGTRQPFALPAALKHGENRRRMAAGGRGRLNCFIPKLEVSS
jgi:hypothetical protein